MENTRGRMEERIGKVADVLIKLGEVHNDRIEGYSTAAKEIPDRELRSLFLEMAQRSVQSREALSNQIHMLGKEPSEGTSFNGKLFRVWMDAKAILTGNDPAAILNSCETGEEAALEEYDDALQSDLIRESAMSTLLHVQRQELQRDHDRIKALHDHVHV